MKTFVHEPIDLPEYESTEEEGNRHYIMPNGDRYPSATTILGNTADKEFLVKWKERVGEREASRISSLATRRGTALHKLVELQLTNQPIIVKDHPITAYSLYTQLRGVLDKNVSTVYAIEKCLCSHRKRIAGRVDAIGRYEDVLSIIDIKSTTRDKPREWITDYFLQTSLYAYMLYEMTGIMATDIVIMMASEANVHPTIYKEKVRKWLPDAMKRVKQYHDSVRV